MVMNALYAFTYDTRHGLSMIGGLYCERKDCRNGSPFYLQRKEAKGGYELHQRNQRVLFEADRISASGNGTGTLASAHGILQCVGLEERI